VKTEPPAPSISKEASRFLAEVFVRGGCFRTPDRRRRRTEGQDYKKGYEVRLPVAGDAELARLRRCLKSIGIEPSGHYRKHRQIIQVVYGKTAVGVIARTLARAGVKSAKLIDPKSVS